MGRMSLAAGRNFSLRIIGAIGIDALVALSCYALRLNLATVSLLFLLSIVLQAPSATFASSVAASFIAAGFLDFFFVPPVLTWRIGNPFDLVALLVFVTTSVLITRLASRASAEAKVAERRRRALERIYQCSERLLALAPEPGVIRDVLRIYREEFKLKAVCFFDGSAAETYAEGQADRLILLTRQAYMSSASNDDEASRVCVRCIRSRGGVTGAIGFENLREPELTARSLVAMTIVALEREYAFQSASRSAAETQTEAFRAALLDALAHEIKTPLATIIAAAGGLLETVTASERELADEIESEALRLAALTSSLLRKAELQCEEIQARMTKVDLTAALEGLIERCIQRYGAERTIHFDSTGTRSEFIAADEELLRLAIGQLLDNAVKYSQRGSAIVMSLGLGAKTIDIRVWNNGSSISAAEKHRIFERFYRGVHGKHHVAGSGLGLYVARRIARAHRGTLILEERSDSGGGISFCLTLPKPDMETKHGELTDELVGSR